jgi:hypothetical protein
MQNVVAAFFIAVFAIAAILFFSVLGALFGAIGGWFVGLFFTETLSAVMLLIFGGTVPVWQLGAFLGFVGSFFRAVQTNKS